MRKWRFTLASILLLALTSVYTLAQASSSTDASTSGQATQTKTKHAKAAESATPKLDINTATKEELSALPGIGDAYSQKIIDNRPYKAKNELVSKKVIPEATYKGIRSQIVAHQTTASTHKGHMKKDKTAKPDTKS